MQYKYQNFNQEDHYNFVLDFYDDQQSFERVKALCNEYGVILMPSALDDFYLISDVPAELTALLKLMGEPI